MKRLEVSELKTSTSTESSVGSPVRLVSATSSIDVTTATTASAANVRVVRSFSSSAWSRALISRPR